MSLTETETRNQTDWTIEDSEELYRIEYWGDPYFSINAAGHVTVSPQGDRGGALDLYELITSLKQRNLELPLLIRFSDILEDRLERLTSAFSRAITRYSYTSHYQGVFPVKCNQQRHVVESLVKYGSRHQFGLEAGSKPELLIALATLNSPVFWYGPRNGETADDRASIARDLSIFALRGAGAGPTTIEEEF